MIGRSKERPGAIGCSVVVAMLVLAGCSDSGTDGTAGVIDSVGDTGPGLDIGAADGAPTDSGSQDGAPDEGAADAGGGTDAEDARPGGDASGADGVASDSEADAVADGLSGDAAGSDGKTDGVGGDAGATDTEGGDDGPPTGDAATSDGADGAGSDDADGAASDDAAVDATPDVPVGDGSGTGDGDAAGPDGGAMDAVVDAGPPPEPVACGVTMEITSPAEGDVVAAGSAITYTGTLSGGTDPLDGYTVSWEGVVGEPLGTSPVEVTGQTVFSLTVPPVGIQTMTARPIRADGVPCTETDAVTVSVCRFDIREDFDAGLDASTWKIFGDASWDAAGFIEMTGLLMGRHGAVYNDVDIVQAGNASVRFRINTGGGTGADGFAMTIIDAASASELASLVGSAVNGGGLGYGVSGAYGSWSGNAFTVEIDTWYNEYNGSTQLHTDPTTEDHVAITIDGDPGNHVAWVTVADIEDAQWHKVRVDIDGTHVVVSLDDVPLIDTEVPSLAFRGGYIFFSGSTGYYTNNHRFDDLEILHGCQ